LSIGALLQFLVVRSVHLTQDPSPSPDLRALHGANVRRLMARLDMTCQDVVEATGLDHRTLRRILQGDTTPHARTLHKLAKGLGVSVDELFYQSGLSQFSSVAFDITSFDKATNPAVSEVIDSHPDTFANWTPTDFEELFSRMAVGGELTEEGTLAAAKAMNVRRRLMLEVSVILESSEAHLMHDFVGWLYRRVTTLD